MTSIDLRRTAVDHDWLGTQPGGAATVTLWRGPAGTVRLASAGTDGTIRIWDPATGEAVGSPMPGHVGAVWGLTSWVATDGTARLASAGDDGTIRTWDPSVGTAVGAPLTGHVGWVRAVTSWVATDGTARLASAGGDGTVRVWHADTGEVEACLRGHVGWLRALTTCTGPQGVTLLASGGKDMKIRIWSVDCGEPLGEPLAGHHGWLRALAAFTTMDGGVRLASASDDGTIRIWDPVIGAAVGQPISGHTAGVRALAAVTGPDRTWLVSASNDSTIRSWDPMTGAVAGDPIVGHNAGVLALVSWTENDGCTWLASASDDSAVRRWNADTGAPAGEPLPGHTAGVLALTAWTSTEGTSYIASAGNDGRIRIWDAGAGTPIGPPLTGHGAGVLALARWKGSDGTTRLASAGYDGVIRQWLPEAGVPVGEPMSGHTGVIFGLTSWTNVDGRPWLASGGDDGTVRVWELDHPSAIGATVATGLGIVWALVSWSGPSGIARLAGAGANGLIHIWRPDTGELLGAPLAGHSGGVLAMTTWRWPDGGMRLTSAGEDGTIRTWEPETGRPVGEPLNGHRGGIRALTSWARTGGGTWLGSAGYDGTIRLWDPIAGRALRTIEVGPIEMWGLSDRPTVDDLLGRQGLATAIAEQLYQPGSGSGPSAGPTVVAVEGPWGCGKSTMLELVRAALPVPPTTGGERPTKRPRRMTFRHAANRLRRYAGEPPRIAPPADRARIVTAWFNPWAHQSGEQLWAGFAHEIIEAAAPALYPTEADREHYWFARNLSRVDRFALHRELRRRLLSPVLGVVLGAVIVPLVIAIGQLSESLDLLDHTVTAATIGLVIAAAVLAAGTLHTVLRYWTSPAATYLPAKLFYGPVFEGLIGGFADGHEDPIDDPLHRARAGALYLHQHSIGELLHDLTTARCQLVVFVDDLDRCSSTTIVNMFEAINVFLSGFSTGRPMRAQFVIGLDPAVVAAHLDRQYSELADPDVALHGEDPSPGWAYLRKLVQLPVLVPAVTDDGTDRFLDAATARPVPPDMPQFQPSSAVQAPTGVQPGVPQRGRPMTSPATATRIPAQTIAWRSVEQHPRVRALLRERLAAQPNRSIREAKRLLNVWQLYERTLLAGAATSEEAINRARHLVILAEIVARWPAIQRSLHSKFNGRRGLSLLADSTEDDHRWEQAVELIGINDIRHRPAVTALRHLLQTYGAHDVAELADALL